MKTCIVKRNQIESVDFIVPANDDTPGTGDIVFITSEDDVSGIVHIYDVGGNLVGSVDINSDN